MTLPQDILERCERVFDYHQASKYTYDSVRALPNPDSSAQPSPFRIFDDLPKAPLPTNLLDEPAPTVNVLLSGLEALPESQLNPPQDLKTLATWLYMADGVVSKSTQGSKVEWLRTLPSGGSLYPCEIYVAAFAIDGLEPGLYHYCVRDFTLRKMREGPATLAQIKRGRPDLEFLKTVPAALFVSTIFWRSAWRYRKRGYRYALLDAGHLIQNLCSAATGLGMKTTTRLRMNHNTLRELIGIAPDVDFGEAEAVQAMVVWSDLARNPMTQSAANGGGNGGPRGAAGRQPSAPMASMPPIPRKPLSPKIETYASILAAHQDCVAPGVAVREIRPPLTELNPLVPDAPTVDLHLVDDVPGGEPLRKVLMKRKITRDFARQSIARDQFILLNRIAFRSGAHFPLFPDGPHSALVRPFWVVNDVTGMDPGAWYYHPPTDKWVVMNPGMLRIETQYLSVEQPVYGNASAVCFMAADLTTLMTQAGPDTYRLAHLEAGLCAQRLLLGANAMNLGFTSMAAFYDDEVRQFFGLQQTGWNILYEAAVGIDVEDAQAAPEVSDGWEDGWRD